jgi:uncharacterized protein YjiS (DUF1127 family)
MPIANTLFAPFVAPTRIARRAGIAARLAMAWRFISTRRHLREMDDRMLKDIGISRSQANFEATRPVWDVLR